MKIVFAFLLSCICGSICAQQPARPPGHPLSQDERIRILQLSNDRHRLPRDEAALNTRNQQNDRGLRSVPLNFPPIPNKKNTFITLSGKNCIDSSFDKQVSINDITPFVESIAHTKDDGVLMVGVAQNFDRAEPSWQQYGLLVKMDNIGNVLWSKTITDVQNRQFYAVSPTMVSELSNGDVFIAGVVDTAQGHTSQAAMQEGVFMARLSASGALIWYKTYNSLLSIDNSYVPVDIRSVNETPGGDLLLCGNTFDQFSNVEVIIRMDNAGNKIWDNNFHYNDDYSLGSEGTAAFYDNGNITVAGISFGVETIFPQTALHFLTLDFASGTLINSRFFLPDYTDQATLFSKSFSHYSSHCVKLLNGHYLFYTQPFSDFAQSVTPYDHFVVMEFDANHNLFDSYTISSNISSNYYGDNIYFNERGDGLFMLKNNPYPFSFILTGSLRNRQITKERFKAFPAGDIGEHGSSGPQQQFCFFNDGSYVLYETYFNNNLLAQGALDFRKMHDEDTSSVCLGSDSLTEAILPYNVKEDPAYRYLGDQVQNQVYPTNIALNFNDSLHYNYFNPCKQISDCDTLKIHGDTLVCNSLQPQYFSVYKNPLCGSFAQWNIDTTAVIAISNINDTTVAITFKNVTWQGQIYSSLFTGQCTLALRDSLTIHVVNNIHRVELGADTILCPGNTFTLHAGTDFSSYLWQDNSIDSTFIVTTPGKYFVEAQDFCKKYYYDTILITTASFPFSIGADTIKCNQDTLTLTATSGFTNYQWLSNYNIQPSADGVAAKVFPSYDTSYIATAQKGPGCFVKDTIHIKVMNSPVIFLGNDTSFCEGQFINLDAGMGFSTYQWNTGQTSERLTIASAGKFAVAARYANGCTSVDSITVTSVFPMPQFDLGNADTVLCANQQLKYHVNIAGAAYYWNDGSSSGERIINTAGLWWLKVSEGGCSATDTIRLTYKPVPVVELGNDTTVCEGSNVLLKAENANAQYTWQDGSTAAVYEVDRGGLYWVRVMLNGCLADDTVVVTYQSSPRFTLGTDLFMCEGEQMLLKAGNDTNYSYVWQDGSTESSFTATSAGLYYLTEGNMCGSFTDSVIIQAGPCQLHMPSGFTPDNNGVNDIFRVKYPFPVSKFEFLIVDRWGKKVFTTTDINKGWNGKLNGRDEPAGTYVWMILYTDDHNKKQNAKGTVVLIR